MGNIVDGIQRPLRVSLPIQLVYALILTCSTVHPGALEFHLYTPWNQYRRS